MELGPRGRAWAALVVWAGLVPACGAARPSATETSSALLDALAEGDAAALGEMSGRSEPEAEALVADARGELRSVAELARARPLELRGRAYLEGGSVVDLVFEDGSWSVASGVLGVPSLESPLDAIRSLHRLLGRVAETGFEAVLARETRLSFHEELERWWRETADPDALPLEIEGDVATVRTPSGGTIELRREAGDWRVVDLR